MLFKSRKATTLGGDAVRLTTSKIMTLAISMLSTMLLARFRTLTEYGTFSQILLVINLASTLFMLGLPNSINYFLARADSEEDKRRFLSVYYTLSTALSIIIGAVLVLAIPLIEAFFHNSLIGKFYYVLALFPWASIITASIENILVVYKRTRFLMVYRLVVSVVTLGSVVVVKLFGWSFTDYMNIFIAIHCILAILTYIIVAHYSGKLRFLIDSDLIKKVFVFSIPMGLAAVVGTLNTEIDKLLIGYLMDTEQMSIYTNAAKELPLTIVASSITAVLLPFLTRMIKKNRYKDAVVLWGYATELSFIIICLVVAGVVTYAEEVIELLYSAKYLPGVGVFRIYTLNLLLRVTYFGIILNACGKTKKIFYCSLVSLGLNVVLNPVFYLIFGMIGPAIATFISILCITLLQLIMTSKVTAISFGKIFPWKSIFVILFINSVLAVIFYFVKKMLVLDKWIGNIPEAILLGVIWCVIYFIIMRKEIRKKWTLLNMEEQ